VSDLYVSNYGDGPDILTDQFGNPTLTGGLDSAVYLSIFVEAWWGNRIENLYGSEVEIGGMLSVRTARDIEEEVRASLAWLLSDGVALSVEVSTEIATKDRLNLYITIEEPNRRRTTYRYGLNWASQAVHILEEGRT